MTPSSFPASAAGVRQRICAPPTTPVVLSVPHAGIATTGFADELAAGLDVRCDADLLVDGLYQVAEGDRGAWGGPYVVATLSRFVCDMNRDPDDVSRLAVPEHPRPGNADGRGFVWTVTTDGSPALARPLSLAAWEARRLVHATYHAAITAALTAAKRQFGFAVLVDGHSMPSVGRTGHKDTGRTRADVVPGDRDGTSCSPALSEAVRRHFEADGFTVAFNNPYRGGFITSHHGRPHEGIHAIQIELRRDLYMNETTFAPKPEGFARLQRSLADLLGQLDHFRP
jgi:N-formylglutamate deformylase